MISLKSTIGKLLHLTLLIFVFAALARGAQAKIIFKNEFLIEDNGINTFILDAGNDVGGNISLQFGAALAQTITYNPAQSWFEFSNDINLNQNELKNVVLQNSSTAPLSPIPGQIYYNTLTNNTYVWNGTVWEDITATGGFGNDDLDSVYATDLDKMMNVNDPLGLELESNSAGNIVVDMQNTGNFVIQTAGTPFAGFTNAGRFQVDNLQLDANEIASTNTNGNINLSPNGNGAINLNANTNISGDLNFNLYQAKNIVLDNQTTAPLSPLPGQIYYNSTDGSTYIWNGTSWEDITENDNFETIYARDADKILNTSNGAFTLATGSGTTNINNGLSTGQVNIGGGSNCVNVNSNTWDISCAGLGSGFTGLSSSGTINFAGASSFSIPQAASDPATCTVGQQYYNTTSNTVRLCTATNTWSGVAPSGNAYVFAYDTNIQTVAVANTFQDVPYTINGQIDGWTHTAGTANFTVNSDGTYMVNMTARIAKNGGANTTLSVRGVKNTIAAPGTFTEIPGSQSYGTAAGSSGDTMTGNFIATLIAGETIKIQMTGGTTGAQIVPGGNGTIRPSTQLSVWRMK